MRNRDIFFNGLKLGLEIGLVILGIWIIIQGVFANINMTLFENYDMTITLMGAIWMWTILFLILVATVLAAGGLILLAGVILSLLMTIIESIGRAWKRGKNG